MASQPAQPGLCAKFHRAVELIGARWSGAIVQILLQGPVRYANLRAAVPDISDRMLSERLRELESEGIVVRSVSQEPPVRVDYALTEKGRALQPALNAVGQWAERWLEVNEAKAPKGTMAPKDVKGSKRSKVSSAAREPRLPRVRRGRARAV